MAINPIRLLSSFSESDKEVEEERNPDRRRNRNNECQLGLSWVFQWDWVFRQPIGQFK